MGAHQTIYRSASGWGAWVLLACTAVLLAGCLTSSEGARVRPSADSDIVAQIRQVDLWPRLPQSARSAEGSRSLEMSRAETFYGDGSPAIAVAHSKSRDRNAGPDDGPATTGALPDRAQPNPGGQGYEMNFENAPIATVAKAILGDILGVGYTIDPRVQGTVNLSSGRAMPKKDLVYVLESALRVSNVALVREAQGYRLVPSGEAAGTGSIDGGGGLEAGYGITVVPLQFVSAQTLTKLLENFATKAGMVRADPARNLLVIQGNGADRRATVDAALTFDADWMRGQSVGIYPVSNSTPEPVIAELEKIIDAGEGGLSQNVVKLQSIARQNAVLVVTRKPDYLKTVASWIARLDRAGSAGTGVKVYRLRYGDSRQIAALLNDMFTGGSSSGLDSSSNQLVPGGGMVASSSSRPGLGGSQPAPSQPSGGLPPPPASSSSPAPASFDARFADASGGRTAQNFTIPPGPYSRGGALAGGTAAGGPGPILANVRIMADIVNNALLIYANQEHYRIIERTIQQLDRPQLQVAIDATIAEVTLNDQLNYGVQFFLKNTNLGTGLPVDSGSIVNTAGVTTAVLSRVLPGFNFLVGTEAQPSVILNALHAVTEVKILSTPSVVVIDNQFASLQVGDQIPITTQTAVSVATPGAPVVNSIDYRNTGVILQVAPRINANGNVLLDIQQEISSVSTTSNTGTLTPTVSQRRVRSSIAVASGQTVLLAGLVSERQDQGSTGLPGLDQVPGLGRLFSQATRTKQRTELIVFIRPQIIRNGEDAYRVAEELRAKIRGKFSDAPIVVSPAPVCCAN
jgi:general secretion pathway protein D